MTIRSAILALAAIAAFTATSLTLADAAPNGGRHGGRGIQHSQYARIPPGVLPCKRGLVWVCQ